MIDGATLLLVELTVDAVVTGDALIVLLGLTETVEVAEETDEVNVVDTIQLVALMSAGVADG